MTTNADGIILHYLEERRRREQPPALEGRLVREDLEARRNPGVLHWPSASTQAPSGRYEDLIWIMRPVPAFAVRVFELAFGATGIEQQVVMPLVQLPNGKFLTEPVGVRPRLVDIARVLGVAVDGVKSLMRETRLTVVERAAMIGWRS